jgi:hypothetical protein
LYSLLESLVAAADRGAPAATSEKVSQAVAFLVFQLVRSGYSTTALDRRALVQSNAWKPAMAFLDQATERYTATREDPGDGQGHAHWETIAETVRLYVHLTEHVTFYDDFAGFHPEFWNLQTFTQVLKHLPSVVADIQDDIQADQWEMLCPELEAALKTLGRFLVFQTDGKSSLAFDISEAMPFLNRVVDVFEKFDGRLGREISQLVRGNLVEELVRLAGILTQLVLSAFEDASRRREPTSTQQAVRLLHFLVRMLMLRVPTCGPKAEAASNSGFRGSLPIDERQLDTDWIEGLWEHAQDMNGDFLDPSVLPALFKAMTTMSLEEQRYRLECVAPLIATFLGKYSEQLRQKEIPPELLDLKVVMNAVLQDDVSVNSDFLEEISFYPCLLEFATKRATIHVVCERTKMTMSSGEPIRLVVPRDNVLDGVCASLNLHDPSARIEVPLEIEFRAGYADDTGRELVDEGEDQGGLRRQWLDRAARHFLSSDLFTSPSKDTASLDNMDVDERQTRGLIFVPSPEAVCRRAQENWEEQFELFGCVLGFALLHKETVPVHFGHNFLRLIFGLKTGAQDLLPLLETVDKTLHTKVKYILDGSYATVGDSLEDVLDQASLPRVFAVNEAQCPELVESTMLKENGDKVLVTEENKEEFIMVLLDRILVSGLARQAECFRRGLLRVVPVEIIERIAELMTVKEIELMVCGADEIDVDDWETHTQYENGYTRDCPPVKWFWNAVRSLSQQSRCALLCFATGSSQVPSGGFRFLQPELFTIQRVAVLDRYPEALRRAVL